MEQGSKITAIELKGIVRNQTKIGVQDGQCDDLVNLRFKDGSWRVADNGKLIELENGTIFDVKGHTQLFVHTNVYHHLLGVKGGKLWWFADIADDNETFTHLSTPVEICDVLGDVSIVQNGHLLTVICVSPSSRKKEYCIFITRDNKYTHIRVNPNGEPSDRDIFPYGEVHFNLSLRDDALIKAAPGVAEPSSGFFDGAFDPNEGLINATFTNSYCRDVAKTMFNEQTEKNVFTRPFLAIAAIKLYDDTYAYASAPVLLYPNEYANEFYLRNKIGQKSIGYFYEDGNTRFDGHPSFSSSETVISQPTYNHYVPVPVSKAGGPGQYDYTVFVGEGIYNSDFDKYTGSTVYKALAEPIFCAGAHFMDSRFGTVSQLFRLLGYDLAVSVRDVNFLHQYSDIFKSFCIFVTPQVDIYDLDKSGSLGYRWLSGYDMYEYFHPKDRSVDEISYDLLNSPFYLLCEYDSRRIHELQSNPIVDLSKPEHKYILSNLTARPMLSAEANDRSDYLPKHSYSYNQKLHIANYIVKHFHGIPIDLFQLNNYSVVYSKGDYMHDVLPNLSIRKYNDYTQYKRDKEFFMSGDTTAIYDSFISSSKSQGYCFAAVSVKLNLQQGEIQVVRYIQPYKAYNFTLGDYANFIESLNPLLCYPDSRATEMTIKVVYINKSYVFAESKTFALQPHRYLNMAYYIDSELKPIKLSPDARESLANFSSGASGPSYEIPKIDDIYEEFPNGLKVSLTNNPFVFPYENTYQVGSREIVALMSNAVAIGTGQTGSAPLYVFCKDGIYALMVDSTGEMTYTNARIIARDVCNNAKSVTPIDNSVVFTTDRGLMSISGSEVIELGASAEGDVFDITNITDKAKNIMFNAFESKLIGSLPASLLDNVDFLTYTKNAIINYNHNDRELMVSNPEYEYTYILDKEGRWSRRDYSAKEYVNNYPTSYRIDKLRRMYKVDEESASVYNCYLLSNIIKLGTIAFKQAYKLVVRGYFETNRNQLKVHLPGEHVYLGMEQIAPPTIDIAFAIDISLPPGTYTLLKGGSYSVFEYETMVSVPRRIIIQDDGGTVIAQETAFHTTNSVSLTFTITTKKLVSVICRCDVTSLRYNRGIEANFAGLFWGYQFPILGCYVFGSYDGRQWALIGGNEKQGEFNDIGCKISHTDVKFLRLCLAGQLSKNSRIDFIEISAEGSMLNEKLR